MVLCVRWAAPADTESTMYMRNVIPKNARWTAMGIGRMQMTVVARSVLMGGNIRVGLEDNLYLKRGVFAGYGQLVEKAINIIDNLGYEIATPADTREMLGISINTYSVG